MVDWFRRFGRWHPFYKPLMSGLFAAMILILMHVGWMALWPAWFCPLLCSLVIVLAGADYIAKASPTLWFLFVPIMGLMTLGFTQGLVSLPLWITGVVTCLLALVAVVIAQHQNLKMETTVSLAVLIAWTYSTVMMLFPGLLPAVGLKLFFHDALIILCVVGVGDEIKRRAMPAGGGKKCCCAVKTSSEENTGKLENKIEKLVAQSVKYFIPGLLLTAVLAAGYWWWAGTATLSMVQVFVSVLLVACPCVFAIAEPLISAQVKRVKDTETSGDQLCKIKELAYRWVVANLCLAMVYNVCAVAYASGFVYATWGILLPDPVIAGVMMAGSSLAMVLSSVIFGMCVNKMQGKPLWGGVHISSVEVGCGRAVPGTSASPAVSPLRACTNTRFVEECRSRLTVK